MVVSVEVDMGLTNGCKKLAAIIARRCTSVPYTQETIKYLSVVLYLIASNQYKIKGVVKTLVGLKLYEYGYFSILYCGNFAINIRIARIIDGCISCHFIHEITLTNKFGNNMYLGPAGGLVGCKRDKDLYKIYRALFYDKRI